MTLSEQQTQRVISALQAAEIKGCSICGGSLSVLPAVVEIRSFHGIGIYTGPDTVVYPSILVECQRCHQLLTFNAISLGVMDTTGQLLD